MATRLRTETMQWSLVARLTALSDSSRAQRLKMLLRILHDAGPPISRAMNVWADQSRHGSPQPRQWHALHDSRLAPRNRGTDCRVRDRRPGHRHRFVLA